MREKTSKRVSFARATRFSLALVITSAVIAHSVGAQGVHLDIALQQNASDGRLSLHGFDFDLLPQFAMIAGKRAHVRGITLSGNSLVSENPGFVSVVSSTALSPVGLLPVLGAQALRFNLLSPPLSTMPDLGGRNVSYWDGTGPVRWGPTLDADEGIRIIRGSLFNPTSSLIANGSATNVPGFVIGATLASGSLHEHLKFLLLPDNGQAPPVGPEDGVYLILIELSFAPYAEWIPAFIGVEAFAGGAAAQSAAVAAIESELLRPLCSDGIDNDKDGLVDGGGGDPGCLDDADMSERGALAQCDNGVDDDLDGLIDAPNDPGCLHATNPIEAPEPALGLLVGCGALGLASSAKLRPKRPGTRA